MTEYVRSDIPRDGLGQSRKKRNQEAKALAKHAGGDCKQPSMNRRRVASCHEVMAPSTNQKTNERNHLRDIGSDWAPPPNLRARIHECRDVSGNLVGRGWKDNTHAFTGHVLGGMNGERTGCVVSAIPGRLVKISI